MSPDRAEDLLCHAPAGPAQQLFLLYHGAGEQPESMEALADKLAAEFPQALIVAVAAPKVTPTGQGRYWYSVRDLNDDNRPERAREAMPGFIQSVLDWQRYARLGASHTALMGFSQGGIMALEALVQHPELLAGRVIGFGARFATLPEQLPENAVVHLLHGKADEILPYGFTVEAAYYLTARGADVTADVIPHIGHTLAEDVLECAVQRLQRYIPKRLWTQAQEEAQANATTANPPA